MTSLHQRALLYTTDPSSQQLKFLIASFSHALLKGPTNLSLIATDAADLYNAIETLTTCFHTPPLERIQLLLWAAEFFLPAAPGHEDTSLHSRVSSSSSLRACRTRLDFARFWLEILKEGLHQHGNGVTENIKWLEYDLNLARERLNERTVEVMVREWKVREFEGCHVDEQGEGTREGDLMMEDDDFVEKMFEHPIFSLEWAMWRDRQEVEVREGA